MVTPTDVRAGRVVAILLGLQAVKETPVSDFTAAGAGRIWSDIGTIQPTPDKSSSEGWMTKGLLESAARFNVGSSRRGRLAAIATPTSLEWILRSNWGPFAGGVFTLADQVSEWLSVGLVESVLEDSPQYFYRIHDAWIPTITIRGSKSGPLEILADVVAMRDTDPVALDALGGITLPALPMTSFDRNVFPGRLLSLVRDPGGTDEEISVASVEISIDQGLGTMWDYMKGVDAVFKAGHPGPVVRLSVTGHVSAETWAIISASRAGTKQAFRFTAVAQSPAKTLQIDLHEVDFEVEPLGHEGQKYVRFAGVGQAHLDDDDNFVSITLS
jgi:hypothetical protein